MPHGTAGQSAAGLEINLIVCLFTSWSTFSPKDVYIKKAQCCCTHANNKKKKKNGTLRTNLRKAGP